MDLLWEELCSDGQQKPDASVWKHLLELRGTALRLWIWHGAKSNSRMEVLARFRATRSEELLRPENVPAPLDRPSVQEAMRKAWQRVARPYLDNLEEREHLTRQRIFICAVLEGADHAHQMARLLLPHWLHDEWTHACQDEGLAGDGCEGAPAPDGLWRIGLPYRTRPMKMCAADESCMQWPFSCRSLHVPRCKQRKARIRMHVGFCVLYLGLCTRGLRRMVDAPCVRVGRTSGQCCDSSGWRSAAQQKTSSFMQCFSRQCLFSICVWHLVWLTYHAAVFFICVASLHIQAPMRLCLRPALAAAECLRKVASCLSHVSQALSLHIPSSHCNCVSRSGPNSGQSSNRCQGYNFLCRPFLLFL